MNPMICFLILLVSLSHLSDADVAHLYFDRNDYTVAAKHLEKFFLENSYDEYPKESLILGKCRFHLGEYSRAEKVLKNALDLLTRPEHKAECLLMLGTIKYERSQYREASLLLQEALHFQTNKRGELLFSLGKSEYKRKNYVRATELLEAARSVRDTPEISYWYGLTLLRLDQYEEADSIFSSLPPNQKWGLRSLLLKGYTLHLMGLDEDARKIFQSISSSRHSAEDSSLVGITHLHLGCIAMEDGKYENAIQHLALAKEVTSQDVSDNALFRMGWSYYKLSKWDEAAQALQILVNRSPQSEFWESACYFLGETEYRRKRYSQALDLFNRLLSEAPDSRYASHSLYSSAYCYYHLDSLSISAERFEKYIDKYPQSDLLPYARYRIGLSAYHTGEYAAVIDALKPLASERTPLLSNEAHYLIALSYYALTDYDSALDELKRLAENEKPMRPEAQKLLGDVLFQKEDYWRAIEAYKQISEGSYGKNVLSSIVDEGRYQIERSLLRLGLYSSPVTMLKVYVRKYPESSKAPRLQMELAQYYLETEHYYQAIEEFERFLELFGSREEAAEAIVGLAKTREKLGSLEKAREEYLKVLEDSPLAPMARFSAAKISFRLGELGRAISECQNVIEEFQGTPYAEQALYMQGKCFISLRRYEEAILVYEKLLSEYPSSSRTEELRFRIALLVLEEGLVEDGLKMLNTKWSSDSLRGEALLEAGSVLFELGQYQDAVGKLLQASECLLLERKAEPLFKAAEALEFNGDYSQANARYRDALKVVVDEKLRRKILQRIDNLQLYLESEERE